MVLPIFYIDGCVQIEKFFPFAQKNIKRRNESYMLTLCPLALMPSGNLRIQAHLLASRASVQKDGVSAVNISVWP